MENELRFYLKELEREIASGNFQPSYIVTATALPTGAVELAVNTEAILEKINYILEAYDENMRFRTNSDIVMRNIMIV